LPLPPKVPVPKLKAGTVNPDAPRRRYSMAQFPVLIWGSGKIRRDLAPNGAPGKPLEIPWACRHPPRHRPLFKIASRTVGALLVR
jgi:hypothetical protein